MVSTTSKSTYQIVWLKRDLRLRDHAPLEACFGHGGKTLLWYNYDQALLDDPHYSDRHWQFVSECLRDLCSQLSEVGTKILITMGDPMEVLSLLHQQLEDVLLRSYEETGIKVTFDRDLCMKEACRRLTIPWKEYPSNGVRRGRSDRDDWVKEWYSFMSSPQHNFVAKDLQWVPQNEVGHLSKKVNRPALKTWKDSYVYQTGGEMIAHETLSSFLTDRIKNYAKGISKPELSRTSSSRLSPYLAWGCLSIRQAMQAAAIEKSNGIHKRQFTAFMSRLRWHDHFIQKFEMECDMEFHSYNRAYKALEKPIIQDHIIAWQTGRTGYPMVDACMRCLNETGYINFRMRAMMVSFFTHHLWQPWQEASFHLSKQFLDFEPGIHYPQLQMQAGTTGTNTLRIYNPIKQSKDHDPEGTFIKKWVPELNDVPVVHIHEPWLMTTMEQQFCGVIIGKTYPRPVVDLQTAGKKARDALFSFRKRIEVKHEAKRIVRKHTIGGENRKNK